MPLSRRYSPEVAPGESAFFGMNFSFVLPPGAQLVSASLAIFTNGFVPVDASADWVIGPVVIEGTAVYARLAGGREGQDYRLVWTASDSDGNVWPRTALVLCSPTS